MTECIFHAYVLAPGEKPSQNLIYLNSTDRLFFELWLTFHFVWMKHLLKQHGVIWIAGVTGGHYITNPQKMHYHMRNPSSDYLCICIFMIRRTKFVDVFPIDSAFFGVGNICIFNDQWSLVYVTVCSTKIHTGTSFSVGTATVLLFMSSMTAGSHSSTGRKKHSSPIWQDFFSRCKTKHKVGPVTSFK